MRRFVRTLLPRSESHLLLASAAKGSDFRVQGVRTIRATDTTPAGGLEAFAVANGFPAGWVAEMSAAGAVGTLAVSERDGSPLAMGWAISRAFYVEEIGATLDPGGGVYLFGDFVAPEQRGRRIQRSLVAERLRAMGAGEREAYAIVHPRNVASIRSYRHEGFEQAGRFVRRWWLGRSWARCRSAGAFGLENGDRIVARWRG
jgi:ribosomal protein S18 acetylase RimI-like enzyme